MKKVWAIRGGVDVLGFAQAASAAEAIEAFRKRSPDLASEGLQAIAEDSILGVEVPGYIASAIRLSGSRVLGPEGEAPELWEEFRRAVSELARRGYQPWDIQGWVRVNPTLNMWSPVVT